MKKLVVAVMVIAFIFSICMIAYQNLGGGIPLGSTTDKDDPITANPGEIKATVLTDEEAIQRISEIKEISIEQAAEIFNAGLDENETPMSTGFQNVEMSYACRTDSGREVIIGAIVRKVCSEGHMEYASVMAGTEYAAVPDTEEYTFNIGNVGVYVVTPKKLQFMTAGVFEKRTESEMEMESEKYDSEYVTVDYIAEL